jgi:hypothetical protein
MLPGNLAGFRSSLLDVSSFNNFGHDNEIVSRAWRELKHRFPSEAGPGKVVSRHVKDWISVRRWLHPGDVEFLEMLDMFKDAVQLPLESADFLLTQGNAGESGYVTDIKIAVGHAKIGSLV